ncbi:hypothetical protein FBF25_04200 [Candidatus Saccharibacteria bacterium oral taxon 488]|jgi:hypothetical protein|nr:hypothetical protein FBF25_04200 [Candidatus Saccharibacteria bacterium oral taxon 488]QLF52228.1 hypothetical protein HW277_04250 [Candidatus Saccharibacteria bacterium oral taxon 488]
MSSSGNNEYVTKLSSRFEKIEKLESTPMIMRDQAVQCLRTVLKRSQLKHNDRNIIENKISLLENIKEESMKEQFSVIYSQMCVLAVSSLEAILKEYFVDSFNDKTDINIENKKLNEIKVTIRDIIDNELNFDNKLGALILERDKPNFQDLKSILSNFENYFNKEIELESNLQKKLCFYLEVRHLLVHKGGVVDKKFINSTKVLDANIKNYKVGDTVEIKSSDWTDMKQAFLSLLDMVTRGKAAAEIDNNGSLKDSRKGA